MRDLRHIIWEIVPNEIRSHPRLVTIRVYLVAWGCLRASRDPVALGASQWWARLANRVWGSGLIQWAVIIGVSY